MYLPILFKGEKFDQSQQRKSVYHSGHNRNDGKTQNSEAALSKALNFMPYD